MENRSLEKQANEARKACEYANDIIGNLIDEIDQKDGEIEDFEAEIEELKGEIEELKGEITNLRSNL